MSITSFGFLCFYVIVLLLYYIVPRKLQWIWLLICSVVFFALSSENLLLCLYPISASAICYVGAWGIEKYPMRSKRILTATILSVMLALFVLKYVNFGVYTFNATIGRISDMKLSVFQFLIPIGISFYTFSILGYVIDVYWKIGSVEKNYFKLLLYGIYFPVMVSGPILRYRDHGKQFFEGHAFDYKEVTFGIQRMAWGFFEKLVISERLAVIVNTVYGEYTVYQGVYIWVAAVAFVLQLYTDFAGCMDIVLGLSQSLGIRLPENFDVPFSSKSISEFWRRWHITLGSWMRDYVFYPLLRTSALQKVGKAIKKKFGKQMGKKIPTYIAMFVLWFTVGLWHGGAWKYIVGSGLLHFLYILIGEFCEPYFSKICLHFGWDSQSGFVNGLRKIRTFLLVSFSFIFFRAGSFFEGVDIIGNGLVMNNFAQTSRGIISTISLDTIVDFAILVLGLIIFLVFSKIGEKGSVREKVATFSLPVRWILYYALIFAVILWGYYGPGYSAAEFIYQGF